PSLERVTDGPAVWTVHVPAGYRVSPSGGKARPAMEPTTAAERDLRCAEAQLQLSSALAEHGQGQAADGAFNPQLMAAQERFVAYCRRAEHRLLAADQPTTAVEELRERNNRSAEQQGFDKVRTLAEKERHAGDTF